MASFGSGTPVSSATTFGAAAAPTSSLGGTVFGTAPPATSTAAGQPAQFASAPTQPTQFGVPAGQPAQFGVGAAPAPAQPAQPATPAQPTAFGAVTSAPSVFGTPAAQARTTFGSQPSNTTIGAGFSGPVQAQATGTTSFGAAAGAAAPAAVPAAGQATADAPTSAAQPSAFSFGGTWGLSRQGTGAATGAAPGAPAALQSGFGSPGTTPAAAPGSLLNAPTSQMTFEDLEKRCNEWKKELDRQEESFLKRATQVNAWDRLITANSERITELNEYMKKVKSDQERLDRELDFVEAQQAELEDMLAPLERQAESMQVDCVQNHTDTERVMTYQAAGKVNLQLQTMADTIKDIIERINNNNHKANGDESPMEVTSKILNMHMDALQNIQNNICVLQEKIEDVNKLMGVVRI